MPCHYDQKILGLEADTMSDAGCIVRDEGAVLLIRSPKRLVSIPGGKSTGTETAVCTAIRETREETGLTVLPTALATVWDNGFHLFDCEIPSENAEGEEHDPGVNLIRRIEVESIIWAEPSAFDEHRWRFPRQAAWLACHLTRENPEACESAKE